MENVPVRAGVADVEHAAVGGSGERGFGGGGRGGRERFGGDRGGGLSGGARAGFLAQDDVHDGEGGSVIPAQALNDQLHLAFDDGLDKRKARGAFFTPPLLAAFLAEWAVRAPADRVLDPSCGEA